MPLLKRAAVAIVLMRGDERGGQLEPVAAA
jgi:hypothetical protein